MIDDNNIVFNSGGFNVISPKPQTGLEWLHSNCIVFHDGCFGKLYLFSEQAFEKIAELIDMDKLESK